MAQSDFRHVAERESGERQLYALIWLYLASERLGQDGRSIIAAVRSRTKLDQWPGPIAMLFLGESSLEEMQAAAWSFDSKTDLMQRCEAYFYAGHYYLLKGDQERARVAFSQAFGTGVKYYLEYAYARLELERMSESVAQGQSGR